MCSPKPGEARTEEARTGIQSLEMQEKGECKAVLDGIFSFLEYSGSSLQVFMFLLMSTDESRDEKAGGFLKNHLILPLILEL